MNEVPLIDLGPLESADQESLTRAERRDQQRQRIMDAAQLCFVRHGFQGASMQQICAEAGMSPGALYRYFSSKESIVAAICEADREEDINCFGSLRGATSAVDGLVEAAMAHITHTHQKGSAALFAEMRSESMRNETIRETVDGHKQGVADMIVPLLVGAMERGEIDPPVKIEMLMPAIMAIGEGMALNDLPARGVPLDQIEIIVRSIIESLLRPTKGRAKPAA
jgi:AcrR family transcriptional regulator